MNQDPLDLLRTSIDDSTIPGVSDRVWAKAQSRRSKPVWQLTFALNAAALLIAVAAFATTLVTPTGTATVEVKGQHNAQSSVPSHKTLEHAFSASSLGYSFEVSGTSALVALTASEVKNLKLLIGEPLFDPQMKAALDNFRWEPEKAFLGYSGWQKTYGVQTCVFTQPRLLVAVPAQNLKGERLSCRWFYALLHK